VTVFCQHILAARWFQPFIVGVILAAGALVGLETYPALYLRFGAWFRGIDQFILGTFVVEMFLKIGAHGRRPWGFFQDPWNGFDFLIVAVCLLPLEGQYLAVLRLARVLRVLRLVTVLPRLQLLVGALLKGLPSMGYVGLLLLLLLHIYAVIGVFLFGTNDPARFGSLSTALLSLFQVVTLDNWSDILYSQMSGSPAAGDRGNLTSPGARPYAAVVYFVSFILLGTMIMLNLFIGVIIGGMQEAQREADSAEREKHSTQLHQTTLSDELKLLERQLEQLQGQLQGLRHRAEGSPDSHINH
jgi:voltage-gated sodium channel